MGEVEFSTDIFNYSATNGPTLTADQEINAVSAGQSVIRRKDKLGRLRTVIEHG